MLFFLSEICFFLGRSRIKDKSAGHMRDVGSRIVVYVLVLAFWAITTASLDAVYRSL